MILTDADQLREALRVALAERDEARAEVERQRHWLDTQYAQLKFLAETLEMADRAMRSLAERQREACAKEIEMGQSEKLHRVTAANSVRATPLVTEVEL